MSGVPNQTIDTLEGNLLTLLAGEYSSLTISFNEEHACNYTTAQGFADDYGMYSGDSKDSISWVSEDERIKALAANSVWTIQWYPHTPAGFHCVGASTLRAALDGVAILMGG